MDPEEAKAAILERWREYHADPLSTITPGSFFRWLREEHPELLDFETELGKLEQVKRWLAER